MSRISIAAALLMIDSALAADLRAADWPQYRHDFARSGVSSEKLPSPLHRQWTYVPAHPPRPAWPEPGRELNRVAFDYVYHVSVANGVVYFGSSADHKVYAVDLATGRERWSFFTEGPVRFAPAVEGDRVFVASDDGWVYCLSASDGRLLWHFYGGPKQEKIIGNGQMISRWPLRTGVGVDRGVVYFAAGMWPSEGVYVYALRAEDGDVLWVNDTSGTMYVRQPHPGSYSMTGVAPQGYVLGHNGQVFVPTGRNVPAAYDRNTGKLLYYRSAPNSWGDRWGGSWAMLAKGLLFNWRAHTGRDFDSPGQVECQPDPKDGIIAFDAETSKVKRDFPGKLCAVVQGNTLYASGSGKLTAYDFAAWARRVPAAKCTKWSAPIGRVYALIMAGNALVTGGPKNVTAVDARSGNVLWMDKFEGQARGLAAADGRLLVSTTEGKILCYGAKETVAPNVISRTPSLRPFPDDERSSEATALARRILGETGKRTGCCLLIGAGDGRLLYQLVKQSELRVWCAEPDGERVSSARQALDAAGLYGVRATIHKGAFNTLGYPDYFADLIAVPRRAWEAVKNCSAGDVYRVLHPYGGRMYVAADGGRARQVVRWLTSGGVPRGEIQLGRGTVQVVRSPLPGADDWTHQYANAQRTGASADERVRLPLKLLWFGRPGPARLVTRHWGGPAPLCANGRMFVIAQRSLIAVDAYTGQQLWRRDDLGTVARWPVKLKGSTVVADSDSVYIAPNKTCFRLSQATGKTLQEYALPAIGLPKQNPAALIWSSLAVADGHILGTMGNDREGLCAFLLDKDGSLRWTYRAKNAIGNNAVVMDDERVYLIDRTSINVLSSAGRRGKPIKLQSKIIALDLATGKVAWETQTGIRDRTELWSAQGVLLATGRSGMTGYSARTGEQLYTRRLAIARYPVIVGDTIIIEPLAYELRTGKPKMRANPFTGKSAQWSYRRSYGCGSISAGRNVLMFRSGTLGVYDLAGDGGVYNFGGVRAGCYVNAIASDGVLLAPPSDAGCTCSYSLRTTIALAPANDVSEWGVFYDRLPRTDVERAALNLGAPGDRRDNAGTMWLAMPRPATRSHRKDIAVPFRFVWDENFGPYRHNSIRRSVLDTDTPWVYVSGLKGLQRADLDLDIFDRGVTSWPAKQPPRVDGRITEPCWGNYKPFPIPAESAEVLARYDKDYLYLGYCKPRPLDDRGKPKPWRMTTTARDAQVWKDDSFEIYIANAPKNPKLPAKKYLHLGVAASGSRYDAAWTYVAPALPTLDIPRVDVAIDGEANDWGDGGLKVHSLTGRYRNEFGKMKAPRDFDQAFRIGWDERGLLLLVEIRDNVVHEWENPNALWLGDSVDIFVAPKLGEPDHYRCVLTPGVAPQWQPRVRLYDRRRANARAQKLAAQVKGKKTKEGYMAELLLPWRNLGITPSIGRTFCMQVLANDDDVKGSRFRLRVQWHPSGDPTSNPSAYQTFRLAVDPSPPIAFRRSRRPARFGLFNAVRPYPFMIRLPSLGAKREDARYSGRWSAAVKTSDEALTAELAIPWKTLLDAGLSKELLMVNLRSRGPLSRAPIVGQGFERLILVPPKMTEPRKLSLRLHFAELDDIEPGQRVFDVKVQGKVVLKDFDVIKAAGGRDRAVVKQINNIVAARTLTIELVPKTAKLTSATAPILSGIEILPGDSAP